jgi:uncharacterized phage-associated protein
MAGVHDVAAYILRARGPMSSMKLQKLVYYSQAWSLAWDEAPLFDEEIEAWANGPVVYELFDAHRGQYTIGPDWPRGNPDELTPTQRETVDAILADYGDLTGRQLSHLTHSEAPWRDARAGLGPTERSNRPISLDSLAEYYGALDAADDATPVDELDWSGWERPEDT